MLPAPRVWAREPKTEAHHQSQGPTATQRETAAAAEARGTLPVITRGQCARFETKKSIVILERCDFGKIHSAHLRKTIKITAKKYLFKQHA